MSFATPVSGEPYTDPEPDAMTEFLSGTNGAGGVREFVPSIVTVDIGNAQSFTQPAHAGTATEAGIWGAASYGWYIDDGTMVDWGFRYIGGTMVDADYDPGEGYVAVPLPVAPLAVASGVFNGWIFGMSDSFATVKKSMQLIVDPPFSTTVGIVAPDGETTFSSFDPENVPPPAYLTAPNGPPVISERLFVIAGAGRYRKA